MPSLTPLQQSTVSDQPGFWPLPTPSTGFGEVSTLTGPLYTSFSYPVTTSLGNFRFYGTVTAASNSVNVQDYNNITLQLSTRGTGVATASIQSTVDGVNLVSEGTMGSLAVSSSILRLTGRRLGLITSCLVAGNVTASLYVLCGQ